MYSGNDLKKDTLIELEGTPYRVLDYSHHALGRGSGVVRTKVKNLVTGNVLDKTFRSTDKVTPAKLDYKTMQYLYRQDDSLYFMDQETFEQIELPASEIGDQLRYLSEGATITVLGFGDSIIGLELPKNVPLKVTHTEAGVRGDTATTALKPATLETGAVINVPLFIKNGDVIKVDTRTGEYLERQK